MPLLPSGRPCPLQTILLSDPIGCESPLQIIMAVCRTFLQFEVRQASILSVVGGHSRPSKFKYKKVQKLPLLSADGVFFKGRETLQGYK